MTTTRTRLLAPLLAALVALPCAGAVGVATAAPAAAAAQVLQPVVPAATQERQILDGLNAERAKVGAPPVTLDPTLERVAQDWADVLGQGDGMKHNPNLSTLLSDFPRWGEIVATADMGNADTHGLENGVLAVQTWMNSAPHKAVLLDPQYTGVGIGLVYTTLWSGGRTVWRSYWVADFGSPRRTALVAANADGSRSFVGIPVKGAILQSYTAAGANSGYLGLPMATEIGPLRAGGYGQHFAGGSVYWSASTGAAVVRGAIRDRWASLGWENGTLGYPTGAEFAVKGGVAQRFQGGIVYWSPATGAQALSGAVLAAYGATGWENGPLGFPTTSVTALRAGSFAHFQNGSVYSGAAGTHVVAGAVRAAWQGQGWEDGALGYPSSEQFGGLAGGGVGQHFTGGSVYSSPASGTHVVPAAVRDRWAAQGWETGRLGYPVSGARTVAGSVVQDFQGGAITVTAGKAVVQSVDLGRGARAL
ncbi:CAP domain-containing protein [Kineococcus rhizosphaerae]|uniref:LGFP repeat-containing protein n=1 Tax=Kineococcus rhizosphaerae TaxID=559628 RepID=A0A2T0R341_9ACTN|nr:CAP domain-containing protein [Kineococcus rhizosphaerae]PRY14466.1 LGFP repeat-containing protein [Kineococcus rhizosphaerae]